MSRLWADPVYGPLARELYGRCGLVFEGGQAQLFRKRLARRAEELGYPSPRAYVRRIVDARDEGEFERLVEMLTVNETYFFREEEHFHLLLDEFWPQWTRRGDPAIRVWSAACSIGCEPYTLAMLLHEKEMGGSGWRRVEIVGSDVNGRVVEQARRGLYGEFALRNTSTYYRQRYFRKEGYLYRLAPEIRERVVFRKHNLLHPESSPPLGRFHAVLCRNAMIYFDLEAKRRVVADLVRALTPGGVLLVGRSESLFHVPEAPPLVTVHGTLAYQVP
ncbi:MAG: protein-glutamate O-methyltransferase CheR [Deferrisomatales bacterium]